MYKYIIGLMYISVAVALDITVGLVRQAVEEATTDLQKELKGLKYDIECMKERITVEREKNENEFKSLRKEVLLPGTTAFTAFEDANFVYNDGAVINFRNEFMDLGANYDSGTSRYTCPTTGIYLFSATFLNNYESDAEATIVVGETETGGYHSGGGCCGKMSSVLVIAPCDMGQTVWVKCKVSGTNIWGTFRNLHGASSFSGVLISLV